MTTEVRLTAINPDDSLVYSVACNAGGELRIEEIPDQTFKGDLDGNLTVKGNISFKDYVVSDGRLHTLQSDAGIYLTDKDAADWNVAIKHDGSAVFRSDIEVKPLTAGGRYLVLGEQYSGEGLKLFNEEGEKGLGIAYDGTISISQGTTKLEKDGSVRFADGKAGFTKDGNLFCTTQRGQLVILDTVSNGLGAWADYTPPSRKDQVLEKWDEMDKKDQVLEKWDEKDKPAES